MSEPLDEAEQALLTDEERRVLDQCYAGDCIDYLDASNVLHSLIAARARLAEREATIRELVAAGNRLESPREFRMEAWQAAVARARATTGGA